MTQGAVVILIICALLHKWVISYDFFHMHPLVLYGCAWPAKLCISHSSNKLLQNAPLFLHITTFSRWLLNGWNIAPYMALNGAEVSGPPLPIGFRAWLPMGWLSVEMKLLPEVGRLLPSSVLVLDYSVHLSTSSTDSSAPFFSYPTLHRKINENGFYFVFFSLSPFTILNSICHCHLCLEMSECKRTLVKQGCSYQRWRWWC